MTSVCYCKDCVFWDITHAGTTTKSREGRCRRYAPTPFSEEETTSGGTVWPPTFDDDWCGEGQRPGEVHEEVILNPAPRSNTTI